MRTSILFVLFFTWSAAFAGSGWAVPEQPKRISIAIPADDVRTGNTFEFPAGKLFPGARLTVDGRRIPQQRLENGNLRFTLPAGTEDVRLYFGKDDGGNAEKPEIFADFTDRPDALKPMGDGLKIDAAGNGALRIETPFKKQPVEYAVYRDFPIPSGAAGKGILLDADFVSQSRLGWSCSLLLQQLDKNGNIIPGSAVDPRQTTMALPSEAPVRYLLPGRLSPDAAALRIRFRLMASPREFDMYGRRLKNEADAMPKLLIRRLTVRTGELLDVRPLNPALFAGSAAGNRMILDGRTGFFYNTFPQSVWAEMDSFRNQREVFWPLGAGTVELMLTPAGTAGSSPVVIYSAWNRVRREMQSLTIDPLKKTATLSMAPCLPEEADPYQYETLREQGRKVRKAVRSVSFPMNLSPGKRSHLAVAWGLDGQVRCFLDGKLAGTLQVAPLPEIDPGKFKSPDQLYPDTVTFGMPYTEGLMFKGEVSGMPFFCGSLETIRVSNKNRYPAEFAVPNNLTADKETVAFFDFSRFDRGVSGISEAAVPAGIRSALPPLAELRKVELRDGGSETMRMVPELHKSVDPRQVLSALNYPVLPDAKDFAASQMIRSATLELLPEEIIDFPCAEDVAMESVTLANRGDRTLTAPFVLIEGEVDPRSYGDIADSMELEKLPEHERIVKLFQFLLRSEDYFISHPAEFDPFSSKTHTVEYRAMSMFNGYCAFECGPLNNLAVNLFVNVGRCPANQTAGYEHSFAQVFYDGGMHLYDLSAQSFFPSRDQASAASLQETESDPHLYSRAAPAAGPEAFIRHGRRNCELHNLQYQERRSFSLRPGESFRATWFNNGSYNDLQTGISVYYPRFVKGTEEIGAADLSRVGTIERPFPHYSNGFFLFDGVPAADNPAFAERDGGSFRYRVESPYPVVSGRYRAEKNDGACAGIEVSDDGKVWRSGKKLDDGSYEFGLGVRARQKFQVRILAPLGEVKRFSAKTCVQMNPRLTTVNLKRGVNRLRYKCDTENGKVQLTLRYRERGPALELPGGVHTGVAPELTKQYYAFDSNGKLEIPALSLPSGATVEISDGFRAERKDEKLIISASGARIGRLVVHAEKSQREAILIAAPGLRIVYADRFPVSDPSLRKVGPDQDYPGIRLRFNRSHVQLPIGLGPLSGNEYFLFTLICPARLKSLNDNNDMLWLRCGGQGFALAYSANWASEFKKAQYGTVRERFKWDFPVSGVYPSQWILPVKLPADGKISPMAIHEGVEIAAVMAIPRDDAFAPELIKALCGLNWNPWRTDP